MIARIWKSQVREGQMDRFTLFIRENWIPALKRQQGIIGVQILRQMGYMYLISLWQNPEDISRMETDNTHETCIEKMRRNGFLQGEEAVEIFELQGGFLRLNGFSFDIHRLHPVENYSDFYSGMMKISLQ